MKTKAKRTAGSPAAELPLEEATPAAMEPVPSNEANLQPGPKLVAPKPGPRVALFAPMTPRRMFRDMKPGEVI